MKKHEELIESGTLSPGIYLGTRRVADSRSKVNPNYFRHQFFVLIPKDPEKFKGLDADLGNGNRGIVVGGYRTPGEKILSRPRLGYRRNERDDLSAIREYTATHSNKDVDRFWKPVLSRPIVPKRDIDDTIQRMLQAGKNYTKNTAKRPVYYPSLVPNILGMRPNSNTFAQTLADVAGIDKRRRDFPKGDIGGDLRLPKKLFKSAKSSGKELITKETLPPGIYLGSRRVAINTGVGKSPVGRHQFFVLVPKDPEKFGNAVTKFGNTPAVLVGAYNVKPSFFSKRRLRYHRNYGNDVKAFREYISAQRNPKQVKFWETHISRSINQGKSTDEIISKILNAGEAYRYNERENPHFYPPVWKNIIGKGINSNTFVQSMADAVNLKRRREDFPGYDPGSKLRIDPEMFKHPESKE